MYVPIHQVPTQVCSTVDERKTRRYEDIKMTQRRHKPIATKRRKANGAPKKTVRWNEGCDDSKTWHQRHEDNRQWLEEQFSKRRSVSKATKSEYRFCPRSDAIQKGRWRWQRSCLLTTWKRKNWGIFTRLEINYQLSSLSVAFGFGW